MQGKKKLRGGILQIRNAPGGTDTIPITLQAEVTGFTAFPQKQKP